MKNYFLISALVPPIIILAIMIVIPLFTLPELPGENQPIIKAKELFTAHKNNKVEVEVIRFSTKMVDLTVEELFLRSQLAMAKSDSISLTVDLVDSAIALVIRGVKVRTCKIDRFKTSYLAKHWRMNLQVFDWLAEPFILQTHQASVPKAPIRVRKAPKDTVEAKKHASKMLPLEKSDVYYFLQFDRNLRLDISQLESPTFKGRLQRWYYHRKLNLITIKDTLLAFLSFTAPRSTFWIQLSIPQNDAIAIYRALPRHAKLAFRF